MPSPPWASQEIAKNGHHLVMMTVEGGIGGRTVEGSQPSISVTLTAGSLLSLGLEVVRDKFPTKCLSAVLLS